MCYHVQLLGNRNSALLGWAPLPGVVLAVVATLLARMAVLRRSVRGAQLVKATHIVTGQQLAGSLCPSPCGLLAGLPECSHATASGAPTPPALLLKQGILENKAE